MRADPKRMSIAQCLDILERIEQQLDYGQTDAAHKITIEAIKSVRASMGMSVGKRAANATAKVISGAAS